MERALRGHTQRRQRGFEDPRMRFLGPDDGGDGEGVERIGEIEPLEQQRQALVPVRDHRQLEAAPLELGEHRAGAGGDLPGVGLGEAVEELGGRESGGAGRVDELAGPLDEVPPEAARALRMVHEAVARRRRGAGELLPDEGNRRLDVARQHGDAVPRQHVGVLLPERRAGEQGVGDVEGHRCESQRTLRW